MELTDIHTLPTHEVAETVLEQPRTLSERLPLKFVASALAAAAFVGAAKAEASIEHYGNTPTGVALNYVDLLSKSKVIEACHLDINNCPGGNKTDNPSPAVRRLYKMLYTPVSAKVSPVNPYEGLNKDTHGSTLVEVHTTAYNKSHQPFCEAVKKIDSEWKIVWSGWSTKANSTCAKPN